MTVAVTDRIEKGILLQVSRARKEPSTLVVFTLEQQPDGIRLTVTESGFDQIPVDRRAKAFASNEGGWEKQMTLIAKHLAAA